MDGCEVGPDGRRAAGGLLSPGKRIPSGQLWTGRPAKYVRDLTVEQIVNQRMGAKHYVDNARAHMAALNAGKPTPASRLCVSGPLPWRPTVPRRIRALPPRAFHAIGRAECRENVLTSV